MAWIESHQSLSRHRKTIRVTGRLATDRHKIIGHLHELWWWGVDNVGVDGCLGDMQPFEIATAAEWDGDPEEFVSALIDAGFIDEDEDGKLTLHDWYDYAGKLIEARDAERERSRRRRAEARAQRTENETEGRPTDDQRTTDGQPPAQYITVPNSTNKDNTSSSDGEKIPFEEIVAHLNLKARRSFKAGTEATKRLIRARWREGFRLHDFYEVTEKKTAQWIDDPKMVGYLRPQTLFSTNFEAYLNEPWPSDGGQGEGATVVPHTSRLAETFRRQADERERRAQRESA